MKNKIFKRTLLCVFLILFILLTNTAFASNDLVIEPRTAEEASTNSDKANTEDTYTNSDLLLFNDNVEISNKVNGNVAIYGNNVNITGEIIGDLLVISNSLQISKDAMIYGNVFAYSPKISVSGIVSDIYAISNDFTLEESGIVGRNLNLYSSKVTLYGKVSRDLNVNTSNLVFTEDFKEPIVSGNLNYWSNSELTIPDGVISGEIKYNPLNQKSTEDIIWSAVSSIITSLVLSLAVILLSLWISPELKNRLGMMLKNNSSKSFWIGLLIAFATISISILLLLFTYGFGGTIAVCALGLLILAFAISNTIFAMASSKLISNKFAFKTNTPFVLISLLILLVLSLLKYIPYFGTIVNIITSLIGLGMIGMNFYTRKTLYKVDDKK